MKGKDIYIYIYGEREGETAEQKIVLRCNMEGTTRRGSLMDIYWFIWEYKGSNMFIDIEFVETETVPFMSFLFDLALMPLCQKHKLISGSTSHKILTPGKQAIFPHRNTTMQQLPTVFVSSIFFCHVYTSCHRESMENEQILLCYIYQT